MVTRLPFPHFFFFNSSSLSSANDSPQFKILYNTQKAINDIDQMVFIGGSNEERDAWVLAIREAIKHRR